MPVSKIVLKNGTVKNFNLRRLRLKSWQKCQREPKQVKILGEHITWQIVDSSEGLNVVCGDVRGGIDKLPDIYWIFVHKNRN